MKRKVLIIVSILIVGGFLTINSTKVQAEVTSLAVQTSTSGSLNFKISLLNKLINFMKVNPSFFVRTDLQISSVDGNTLTVKKDDKKYKVDTTDAIFVRRYWGLSTLDEVAVGDKVSIIGIWTNKSKKEMQAFIVRDLSIQEKNDEFTGNMNSVISFSFNSKDRGTWTVDITPNTKLLDNNNQTLQITNMKTTDNLWIDGLIRRNTKTIVASEIIDKDYPSASSNNAR